MPFYERRTAFQISVANCSWLKIPLRTRKKLDCESSFNFLKRGSIVDGVGCFGLCMKRNIFQLLYNNLTPLPHSFWETFFSFNNGIAWKVAVIEMNRLNCVHDRHWKSFQWLNLRLMIHSNSSGAENNWFDYSRTVKGKKGQKKNFLLLFNFVSETIIKNYPYWVQASAFKSFFYSLNLLFTIFFLTIINNKGYEWLRD